MKQLIFTTLSILVLACADTNIPVDCTLSGLRLNLVSSLNASGCGNADGTIRISASGGVGPYDYAISNQPYQSSGDFENMAPGIYSFVVKDTNGCEADLNNVTLMATNFAFSADIIENTKCVGGNGSVIINVLEGFSPFFVSLKLTYFLSSIGALF